MADALRWDYLPDAVRKQGLTLKTVAASLSTHTSLPTMISGVYPSRHEVFSWQDKIPEVNHLLDHPELEAGYYQPGENAENDGTFSILDIDERTSLETLLQEDNDWVYFERHHGGHAPFNAIEPWQKSWDKWVDTYAGDNEKYRTDYERAIKATVADFNKRLKIIAEYDSLDDTLIVFTADHGEYLGENGLVGHTLPLGPEAVYVPTVFIHPSISEGRELEGIMRHIDIYPTLLDALNIDLPSYIDGHSIGGSLPQSGYSIGIGNVYFYGRFHTIYTESGLWDENGGYVFGNGNVFNRLAAIGNTLLSKWNRQHLRRRGSLTEFYNAVYPYLLGSTTYGEPRFSKYNAKKRVDEIQTYEPISSKTMNENRIEVETRNHLEDLGYL